jgi:hypothetical protein
MSPEEKSAQYLDLNANERLLEIQAEIVTIEKRRLYENLTENRKQELKARIDFLASEQRMIFEDRYSRLKNTKSRQGSNDSYGSEAGINKIIENEIAEDKKIEGELKEIIDATKDRMWYEKWWGKLIIIMLGAMIISLLSGERSINLYNLLG